MLKRFLIAGAIAAAISTCALAQNVWTTPGGSNADGKVEMCLNSSGQAVPTSASSPCPITITSGGSPVSPSAPLPTSGAYPGMVAGSTLTRANNTTTYTANTAVCANTATTVCAPITISLALTNAGKGIINRVTLLKSSSTMTNASFIIWFYSAAPKTSTPSLFDDVNYTGPYAADMPNYLGSATCSTPTATSDTSTETWYECSLNNPNTGGAIEFQALSGSMNIDALISVTAAYAPAAQETFTPYVGGIY